MTARQKNASTVQCLRRANPLYDPEFKSKRSQRGYYEKRLFDLWIRGRSIESLATEEGLQVEEIRRRFKAFIKELREVRQKWKRAEVRCHALAMELCLLRLGKDAPPDQPIETLNPPKPWLKLYKHIAHIDTVNQLRAVDTLMLLALDRFPIEAIDWAVMKLEKLGLSHRLQRPSFGLDGSHRRALREIGDRWH